ncbi:hypothetical protein, partial [Polaromonas sp.]|uniref:hypothetical protein n=1 Tax=Polaromonas sp. TaxID=1869339 RepID=UPI0024873E26
NQLSLKLYTGFFITVKLFLKLFLFLPSDQNRLWRVAVSSAEPSTIALFSGGCEKKCAKRSS